jgi:hypothetical protein
MSRGRLVVKDRSFGRCSPMKAGGGIVWTKSGAVRHLSVAVGGQGCRGEGSGGGGSVHRRGREENG